MAIAVGGGCKPKSPEEASCAEQAALVRGGVSETVQIETVPASDEALTALSGLTELRTLLLDHSDSRVSAVGFVRLKGLGLVHLRYRGRGVDDEAATRIAELKSLRILNLPQAEISNVGLGRLAELPELEQLRLGGARVSIEGFKALAAMPGLKRLHLIDIPVGDAGLKVLGGIKQLESLYLDGAEVSEAAVDELFRVRPELHVHFDQRHHDRDPSRHSHAP